MQNIVSDKRLQFAIELIKKLNKMLEIETKLLMFFHVEEKLVKMEVSFFRKRL